MNSLVAPAEETDMSVTGLPAEQLEIIQSKPVWSDQCGEAHFERVKSFRSIVEEVDNLKVLETTFEDSIRNGKAIILELLPFPKQIRVRAAIEAGNLVILPLEKHSRTVVVDRDAKKSGIFLSIINFFDRHLKLKDVLSV